MAAKKRKPLSFSTTLRNPERIASFLDVLSMYEGQILNNEVIENTIKFDGTEMESLIPYIYGYPIEFLHSYREFAWEYNSNLNSDNGINFNSQLIGQHSGLYGSQSIYIGTPATFTMPDHDVTLNAYINDFFIWWK